MHNGGAYGDGTAESVVGFAHTSKEAVGIFGAILLWAGLAHTVYYFGGNGVIIRFLPIVPIERRLSFLVSCSILIFLLTISGILPFAFSPSATGPA